MKAEGAGRQAWRDAVLALQLLQIDPLGIGGVWMRAGHGPVQQAWLAMLGATGLSLHKLPHSIDDERLLGGLDLARTLHQGRIALQPGLLNQADGGVLLLPMAERLPVSLAARLGQALDQGTVWPLHGTAAAAARFAAVALDESDPDEDGLAPRLAARLGIWLDLRALSRHVLDPTLAPLDAATLERARATLQASDDGSAAAGALCELADALGVADLRAPILALRVARACAALRGDSRPEDQDLAAAVRLVLGARATRLPQAAPADDVDPSEAPPPPEAGAPPAEPADPGPAPTQADAPPAGPEEPAGTDPPAPPDPQALQELLIAAAVASLPPHLLDRLRLLRADPRRSGSAGASGQARRHSQHGRPLPPRAGPPKGGSRLHLLATLRAAAPRQRLRGLSPGAGRVAIRSEDFHVHRFEQRTPSCVIFALDASGSAALERLAEAKGAVESLLMQSYARRDQVCVLAFRGAQAWPVLAPTRSLVRARRALAGLPAGGGTPLPAALRLSIEQAQSCWRHGSTPMLVVLSDGRANVGLDGQGGRERAGHEALAQARAWQTCGFPALWIDTGLQPDERAGALARAMQADYLPMPRLDAGRLGAAVRELAAGRGSR